MRAHEFSIPNIGINVRSDGNMDYADLIVDGKKKLEILKQSMKKDGYDI